MTDANIREQLHKQIEKLRDEVVEQVADFALFIMARRRMTPSYSDWGGRQWQDFALEQIFFEEDEVEYSLEDAQEIYEP